MPLIIGIGGGHSGSGKTTVACAILQKLKGWGAIKYTRTPLYSSLITDDKVLSEENKDTRRLLDAGAQKVLWVCAPSEELGKILPVALEMLAHLNGIIIEGNSAVRAVHPHIVIFAAGSEGNIKEGAEDILRISDVVVFDKTPPPATPDHARRFRMNEMEGCVDFVIRHLR